MSARHAEVEQAIAQDFGHKLEACDALADLARAMTTQPWQGRLLDADDHAEKILVAILARSYGTYGASVELARIGFGDQACMLNRSLFEDAVDAYWTSLQPELAVDRLQDHHTHGRMLLADAIANHDGFFDDLELPTFDSDERERLDELFGDYGHRSWTGLSLHTKVQQVRDLFPTDEQRDTLDFYRRFVHRENNGLLHMGAPAFAQIVTGHVEDVLKVRFGPSNDQVDHALLGALWPFFHIVRLALMHFEFSTELRDQVEEAERLATAAFKTLSPRDLQGVGRNDPCPCESGRKYKRCHGR